MMRACSTNSTGKEICQQLPVSAVNIFLKNAYLDKLLETCNLYFSNIGRYDSIA
jgi:hypothetical protein